MLSTVQISSGISDFSRAAWTRHTASSIASRSHHTSGIDDPILIGSGVSYLQRNNGLSRRVTVFVLCCPNYFAPFIILRFYKSSLTYPDSHKPVPDDNGENVRLPFRMHSVRILSRNECVCSLFTVCLEHITGDLLTPIFTTHLTGILYVDKTGISVLATEHCSYCTQFMSSEWW